MVHHARLGIVFVVTLVAAGCLGSTGPSDPATVTTEYPSESPTPTYTAEPTTVSTSTLLEPTSTPSETTQRTEQDCNGVSVAFYKLGDDVIWDPDRVPIGVSLGAGGNVTVGLLENNTLLGTAQSTAPSDTGVAADGLPIHIDTKLSGNHTIRLVAYPTTNGHGQFDPETATPCRRDGAVVRTESRTINFSEFSNDSTPSPEAPTQTSGTTEGSTPTNTPDDITQTAQSATTYPVEITVAELSDDAAKERALAAEKEYLSDRLQNATCLSTWGTEPTTVEKRGTVINRTADSVYVEVTHPFSYSKELGRTDVVADGGSNALYVVASEGTRRVRGDNISPC